MSLRLKASQKKPVAVTKPAANGHYEVEVSPGEAVPEGYSVPEQHAHRFEGGPASPAPATAKPKPAQKSHKGDD